MLISFCFYVLLYFFNSRFCCEGVMLIGAVMVLEDAQIKTEIWRAGDTLFFFYRNGINDPDYCVLKFTAVKGRYYCDLKTKSFEL